MRLIPHFLDWRHGTKPTDLLSSVLSVVSVTIAFGAFYRANQVSEEQAEAAAPVLSPGTPLTERGQRMRVATEYAVVTKRADRLFLDRRAGRFVIPLRNGGSGIAMTVGLPVIVESCEQEPARLPASAVLPPLGTYMIPSGESDQLGYLQPKRGHPGSVLNQRQLWYSFDYKRFGLITSAKPEPASLLIWYTDGAQRTSSSPEVSVVPSTARLPPRRQKNSGPDSKVRRSHDRTRTHRRF